MDQLDDLARRYGAADDICFARKGSAGIATLTRQHALNALTYGMCRALHDAVRLWRDDDAVSHVVIMAEPGRAFCAGGDVKAIWQSGMDGKPDNRFFHDEYRMNAALGACPKPVIALVDGIVMGGGVGISAHGLERVVTENTRFAMPETGIGLIPDVGGTHLLAGMPNGIGLFLGLTGLTVGPADCLVAGYGTRYVPAARMADLADALISSDEPHAVLDAFGENFADEGILSPLAARIEAAVKPDAAADVHAALVTLCRDEPVLAKAAARLETASPTSFALTLEAVRRAAGRDLAACLGTEYRVVSNILCATDLYEGIRATLIDRSRPAAWSPATIADIDPARIAAWCDAGPFGDLDLAGI